MPWETSPPVPFLEPPAAVHVWLAGLDHQPSCHERSRATLSDDERARADRFRFARDRNRFTAGRAALRMILSRYLGGRPESLRFAYGPNGKPFLPAADIAFNLSHAGDIALVGVTRGRAIGIDVEVVAPLKEKGLIGEVFSPRQAEELRALPTRQCRQAFYAGWTRKEAYIKARGDGLSIPLTSFEVSLCGGTELLRQDGRLWRIVGLSPGRGYAGALAVEGDASALSYWRWEWDCACTNGREGVTGSAG